MQHCLEMILVNYSSHLINSESQDNRLPKELFMVRAECSAFLHVQFPQDTPKTSRLLTKEQTTPSHQKKKRGQCLHCNDSNSEFPIHWQRHQIMFSSSKSSICPKYFRQCINDKYCTFQILHMAAQAERTFWGGGKKQNQSSSFTIIGVIYYLENQKPGPPKPWGTVTSKAEQSTSRYICFHHFWNPLAFSNNFP